MATASPADGAPRVVIAGVASGVGKTTVTVAIARALRARGLRVAVFKCGPDCLDPTDHARAIDGPCHNLDGWMMGCEVVRATFARAARGADISLIEGVMGLYDGANAADDSGSAAEIAKWREAPVLPTVDAGGWRAAWPRWSQDSRASTALSASSRAPAPPSTPSAGPHVFDRGHRHGRRPRAPDGRASARPRANVQQPASARIGRRGDPGEHDPRPGGHALSGTPAPLLGALAGPHAGAGGPRLFSPSRPRRRRGHRGLSRAQRPRVVRPRALGVESRRRRRGRGPLRPESPEDQRVPRGVCLGHRAIQRYPTMSYDS